MSHLKGQVAVITGGAGGIGRACALALAELSCVVVVIDNDATAVALLQEHAATRGLALHSELIDLLDRSSVVECFLRIHADIGPVDILINNVGQSARERTADFHESDAEVWDFIIAINLFTTMFCTRQVVGDMRARRKGRVVNIGSNVHHRGAARMAEYAAAKAGIVGFTRSLATELAPWGITVNAVSPGPIRTRAVESTPPDVYQRSVAAVPMGRFGECSEVAETVLFLVREGSYITGQEILVNGGSAF